MYFFALETTVLVSFVSGMPIVLKFLDDSQPYLRRAATNALRQIDPEAAAKAGVK